MMQEYKERAAELPPPDPAWTRLLAKAERDTTLLMQGVTMTEEEALAWLAGRTENEEEQ